MSLSANRAQMTAFTDWICRQGHRDDAIGDLARDVRADLRGPRADDGDRWPRGGDLETLRRHLEERGASDGALAALDRAWSEWTAAGYRERIRRAALEGMRRGKP